MSIDPLSVVFWTGFVTTVIVATIWACAARPDQEAGLRYWVPSLGYIFTFSSALAIVG